MKARRGYEKSKPPYWLMAVTFGRPGTPAEGEESELAVTRKAATTGTALPDLQDTASSKSS
jgi:hypothetical protein